MTCVKGGNEEGERRRRAGDGERVGVLDSGGVRGDVGM